MHAQAISKKKYHLFKEADNTVEWYSLVLSTCPAAKQGKAMGKTTLAKPSECRICWEPLQCAPQCRTKCGHTLHAGCLQTWKTHMPKEGCPARQKPL